MADESKGKRVLVGHLAEAQRRAEEGSARTDDHPTKSLVVGPEKAKLLADLMRKMAKDRIFVPPRAKWGDWRLHNKAYLWEAVVLSLGFDPRAFDHRSSGRLGAQSIDQREMETGVPFLALSRLGVRNRKKTERILNVAVSHVGDTLPVLERAGADHPYRNVVRFREYAEWARVMGFPVPKGFPAGLPLSKAPLAEKVRAGSGPWPWGSYETRLLSLLSEAATTFWVKYDPNDLRSAPTTKKVEKWLREHGASGNEAEAIAKILRVDGLRTGPR